MEIPTPQYHEDLHCIEQINYTDRGNRHWVIRRNKDTLNVSSYWVLRVDKNLIKDHSDIFNEGVLDLISTMISLKQGIFTEGGCDDPGD